MMVQKLMMASALISISLMANAINKEGPAAPTDAPPPLPMSGGKQQAAPARPTRPAPALPQNSAAKLTGVAQDRANFISMEYPSHVAYNIDLPEAAKYMMQEGARSCGENIISMSNRAEDLKIIPERKDKGNAKLYADIKAQIGQLTKMIDDTKKKVITFVMGGPKDNNKMSVFRSIDGEIKLLDKNCRSLSTAAIESIKKQVDDSKQKKSSWLPFRR